MTMIRWEPFNDLISLREAMNRLLEDSYVQPRAAATDGQVMTLPLEVYQTSEELVVKALVPGVRPEDIEINVLGETLTIKGETKGEQPEGEGYFLREFRYGRFGRSINLPFPVNTDQAKAKFEHGVLWLHIPKAASARPRQIKVTAGEER